MEPKETTTRNSTPPDSLERVVLILGSNQGDRAACISRALALLTTIGQEEQRSRVYESDPWGFVSDTPFYNQVVTYRASLPPLDILRRCQEIERQLGRVRDSSERYISRPIDIDILFHGTRVIQHPDLLVPHPLLARRRFALLPLEELLPAFLHPVLGKTVSTLLEECPDNGCVTRVS